MKDIQSGTTDKYLIFAIHGVGDPNIGDIEKSLIGTINEGQLKYKVNELYWNKWARKPEAENAFQYIMELSGPFMEAICLPVRPKSISINKWTIVICKIVERIAPIWAITVPYPVFCLMALSFGFSLKEIASYLAIAWIVSLFLFIFIGIISLNGLVFWGCIRVGLLPIIWSPLSAMLILSSIPWPIFFCLGGSFLAYAWILSIYYPWMNPLVFFSGVANGHPVVVPPWWIKDILELLLLPFAIIALYGSWWMWGKMYDRNPVKGIAKILGDIFLYLGSPRYRSKIVENGSNEIYGALTGDTEEIIVCAHSLGSVVSVDVLFKLKETINLSKVTLITAGSPLYRMFWRFFPAVFPAPSRLAMALHHEYEAFKWINVYRRLDYVGGSLGLTPIDTDLNTKQWWPMHVNYWSDVIPVKMAIQQISISSSGFNSNSKIKGEAPSFSRKSHSLWRLKYFIGYLVLIWISLLLPVFLAVNVISEDLKNLKKYSDFYSATDKRETKVRVQYWPNSYGGGMFDLNLNIIILDRNLQDNRASPFLVDVSNIPSDARARGVKFDNHDGNPYYELMVDGTESASRPDLFVISNSNNPNILSVRAFNYIFFTIIVIALLFAAYFLRGIIKYIIEYIFSFRFDGID